MISETFLPQRVRLHKINHFLILTSTSGRAPLRARKMIEFCEDEWLVAAHPQCVSRSKLNLRRPSLRLSSSIAAEATSTNDTNCCQSMLAT